MNAITTAPQHSQPTVLRPQSMRELLDFAQIAAKSTMLPRDYIGKPENVVIAVQLGSELGLAPMQALQNIAIINGRPAVFGDAMLGLVKQSPLCEDIEEHFEGDGDRRVAVCIAKRAGKRPVHQSFSVEDAKRANLWGKSGPWQQYPDRMLQMRARGFALRDAFPDVLRGLIGAEEAGDIPTIEGTAEPAKPEATSPRDKINAEVKLHPQMPTGPVDPHPVDLRDAPKRMTWTQLLKSFEMAIADASAAEEIKTILRSPAMTEAKAHIGKARSEHQQKLDEIMILADAKLRDLEATTPGDDDDEAPAIEGTEKVMAG